MSNWTKKQVLKEHTLAVIIITFALTMALSNILNNFFSEVTILGSRLYGPQTAENLPIVFALFLMIPIGYSSILLIRFFLDKQNIHPDPTYKLNTTFKSNITFKPSAIKWYSVYGKIFGFILFVFLADFTSENLFKGYEDVAPLLYFVTIIIVPLVATFFLNKFMMILTRTNRELIKKINSGNYDGEFASHEQRKNVLKKLKRGRATTIEGALQHMKFTDNLSTIGFFFAIPLAALFSATPKIKSQGAGASYSASSVNGLKRELKSKADANAKQKQQQADFSRNRFARQHAYNSKYSETEYNYAKRDEIAAAEAKRNADSFK